MWVNFALSKIGITNIGIMAFNLSLLLAFQGDENAATMATSL